MEGRGGILGYALVSTGDQDGAGQTKRLEKAGAIKVFTDVMSGKSMDRPGLADLLAYARKGDTLAVVRLDRLGRSLAELLVTVEKLHAQGVALLSLEEKIDTSRSEEQTSELQSLMRTSYAVFCMKKHINYIERHDLL